MQLKKIIRTLALPLFADGAKKLYVAVGCDRVYVAEIPSTKCTRCNGTHDNIVIHNESDIESNF